VGFDVNFGLGAIFKSFFASNYRKDKKIALIYRKNGHCYRQMQSCLRLPSKMPFLPKVGYVLHTVLILLSCVGMHMDPDGCNPIFLQMHYAKKAGRCDIS
jgi:hypothetical protein